MFKIISGRNIIILALLLLGSLCALLYFTFSNVQNNYKKGVYHINQDLLKKRALTTMASATRDRSLILIRMYRETDFFKLDDLNQLLSEQASKFIGARDELYSLELTIREKEILDQQIKLVASNAPLQNRVSNLFMLGKHKDAESLLFGKALSGQNSVLKNIHEIIKKYEKTTLTHLSEIETERAEEDEKFKILALLLLLSGSLFISLLIIFIYKREQRYFKSQMTLQNAAADKLSYQASHDPLTGLINRREFELRLKKLLEQSIDKENHAVLYLDLDQFKVINDSCGHHAGDELLRQLPLLIKSKLRGSDLLARIGGDEFAIILMNCNLPSVKKICSLIIEATNDFQFLWDGKTFKVGVSIGIVEITDDSISLYDILRFADSACYAAKDAGRNQFKIHAQDDVIFNLRNKEMDWLSAINNALENSLFILYAQIIVPINSDSGLKPSYELLIRMELEGKIILPGAFLPAAERYQQMIDIDKYVISKSISLMSENRHFLEQVDHISINLSTLSLANEEFIDFLIDKIDKSDCHEKICLEITETAVINNLTNIKNAIIKLRGMGIRFSLDDFGSGQSSYAYLKNLDIDYLKIDGYFIKDIVSDSIDRAMVKSMCDIAVAMGKKTIGEFVENDQILKILKEIGVDYAQGYGIGKPIPFVDVIESYSV